MLGLPYWSCSKVAGGTAFRGVSTSRCTEPLAGPTEAVGGSRTRSPKRRRFHHAQGRDLARLSFPNQRPLTLGITIVGKRTRLREPPVPLPPGQTRSTAFTKASSTPLACILTSIGQPASGNAIEYLVPKDLMTCFVNSALMVHTKSHALYHTIPPAAR